MSVPYMKLFTPFSMTFGSILMLYKIAKASYCYFWRSNQVFISHNCIMHIDNSLCYQKSSAGSFLSSYYRDMKQGISYREALFAKWSGEHRNRKEGGSTSMQRAGASWQERGRHIRGFQKDLGIVNIPCPLLVCAGTYREGVPYWWSLNQLGNG